MSADNGVFIARFKDKDIITYRVCYGSAIENCSKDNTCPDEVVDAYRNLYFKRSPLFYIYDLAKEYAEKLLKEIEDKSGDGPITVLEYGICDIVFDEPFNFMNEKKSKSIIDKYFHKSFSPELNYVETR